VSIVVVSLRVTFIEVVFVMKRVTANRKREALDDLKALAVILNFDWESGDAKQIEKLQREMVIFLWINVEDGLKNRAKAKSVQEELKADLLPILSPEGEVDPEKAFSRLQKLLRKLNEVESKTEWEIDSIEYEWESVIASDGKPDTVLMPLAPADAEWKSLHIHPTAELNLLGYRWHFGRTLFGKPTQKDHGFSREILYQIVLDAFRSGAIERLRTCPQCKVFFVAEDARQQFCSDEHRNEFNNKKRLESGYFSDLRRRARARELQKARELKRKGKSVTEIQKQTGLSLRVLKRERVIH
jgi:hypothetical protein